MATTQSKTTQTRKKAAKKTAKKTASKKRTTKSTAKTVAAPETPSGEARHQMIAEAAYFISLRRGGGGDPTADWLCAEEQIDATYSGSA